MRRRNSESILRNLVFGVQDSFGSTVGFLSGAVAGGITRETLIFTGFLLILVEAFSMGLGSLISEHTVEENEKGKALPLFKNLQGSITMFVAYLIAGLIPLAPYIFFWNDFSLLASITLSLIALCITGYVSARIYKINIYHHVKELLIVGVLAILAGVFVGRFFGV